MMAEETMNAVGILITRAVMVKGERAAAVASEEERRGKTGRSAADNDAIVQILSLLARVHATRSPKGRGSPGTRAKILIYIN